MKNVMNKINTKGTAGTTAPANIAGGCTIV
jgi:hypothetical protein